MDAVRRDRVHRWFNSLAPGGAVKISGFRLSLLVVSLVGLVFVYRSFYGMRIPVDERDADVVKHQMRKG